MKSLLSKNLTQFLVSTVIILLCSLPLFYFIMEYFYAEDLDELIEYRSNDFIDNRLSTFTSSEIEIWNKYNEDVQILKFDSSYTLGKSVQEPFHNAAEGHSVDFRVFYSKIEIEEKPYVLMSRIPMIEMKDLIQTLIFQYGILFTILIISFTITQRLISKRLWKPFYDSLSKIESFNLEQGVMPQFTETNTMEFARLNSNLEDLIDKDLKVYIQQKEFIENASHELQTPLAVLQSQLDMLLQDSDLTKSQTEIIQPLYAVTSRLTRLNKNLLLLDKIDNSQFKEKQDIDFNDVLNTQLSYLKDLAENYGITVSVNIANSLHIVANKTLLESLINNIIVNAIRHNVEKGSIVISVQNNIFSVSNTGKDTALNQDKVFKRFSRTSEEKKGNGLGLSIVYQICKLHNWNIEYIYQNEKHIFLVEF